MLSTVLRLRRTGTFVAALLAVFTCATSTPAVADSPTRYRLEVLSTKLVDREGRVTVSLRCSGKPRCRGVLWLATGSDLVRSRVSFMEHLDLPAGKRRAVDLRLFSAFDRSVRRTGKRRVTVFDTGADAQSTRSLLVKPAAPE